MPNLDELIKTIEESQKTLFIVCGYPYSGKSYVVNQIKSHADIIVVTIDDIFKAKEFDWDTNNLPDNTQWQEIFDESYENVKGALAQGKNVLYDSTNQTIVSRDKLREVATTIGATACIIYIKSSAETVWKRWEENQKNSTRSVVSRELIQMTINQFEVPTDNENVITIIND